MRTDLGISTTEATYQILDRARELRTTALPENERARDLHASIHRQKEINAWTPISFSHLIITNEDT